MDIGKFYGAEESSAFSYLEFGSIDIKAGKKEIWDFRLHDKAYDWLMLARYANDMVTYLKMTEMLNRNSVSEIINLYLKEMHHKADASINLTKLCALAVMKDDLRKERPSFFEIGQTIFGCVEGMEFCRALLARSDVRFPAVELRDVIWYGVDISDLFNRLSIMLHGGYNIRTMLETKLLQEQADVFFAKGVTLLYVVRKTGDLMNILDKGKMCVFDYSFSMEGEQDSTIGTGKHVRYLNYHEFHASCSKDNRNLYVRKGKSSYNKSTNRIFVDCVYAEEDIFREFMELDIRIRKELMSKLSLVPGALILLDAEKDAPVEWISIEEFVATIREIDSKEN